MNARDAELLLKAVQSKHPPDIFSRDGIAYARKFNHDFNAKTVEYLYSRICENKHPYLSFFGLAPNIQPEVEIKPTYQF